MREAGARRRNKRSARSSPVQPSSGRGRSQGTSCQTPASSGMQRPKGPGNRAMGWQPAFCNSLPMSSQRCLSLSSALEKHPRSLSAKTKVPGSGGQSACPWPKRSGRVRCSSISAHSRLCRGNRLWMALRTKCLSSRNGTSRWLSSSINSKAGPQRRRRWRGKRSNKWPRLIWRTVRLRSMARPSRY